VKAIQLRNTTRRSLLTSMALRKLKLHIRGECRDCQRFERKLVGCVVKVPSLIPGASSLASNQIFARRLRSSNGAELCCSH
jgi:hypothetical protein